MPFVCGQQWTGTTRSSHSPSAYAVDFNAPGDLGKPAVASAPGVVVRTQVLTGSYGRNVIVDHGGGYTTLYAHLRNITTTVGTHLDQGDLIGYVGESGNVTGPHLHFEERRNGAYFRPYFHRTTYRFGTTRSSADCGDRPIAGDWDGDGKADVGVYRSTPRTGQFRLRTGGTTRVLDWGAPSDTPIVGDWDGNRRSEVGRRRLGTTVLTRRLANGRSAFGYYRATSHTFHLLLPGGRTRVITWGGAGDRPVTGDWNRDGRTDVGTFRPATRSWVLRVPRAHGVATRRLTFGRTGDLPVVGDWNGDGTTDLGTWTPGNARFTLRTPKGAGVYVTSTVTFGNRR
jgi:hypothetical protein